MKKIQLLFPHLNYKMSFYRAIQCDNTAYAPEGCTYYAKDTKVRDQKFSTEKDHAFRAITYVGTTGSPYIGASYVSI